MYTLIVFLVIGLLFGIIQKKRHNWDLDNICLSTFVSVVLGFVVALLLGYCVPDVTVTYGPNTLVAMRSTDSVSGSFVWGSGSVNGQVYYNFLMRNDDGSLTPGQVTADSSVHIVEDPHLSGIGYWSSVYKEPNRSSFIARWALGRNKSTLISNDFRVPEHTVVQSFSVN